MFMNGNLYEERGEDRRIRKSKKALQEALIRLLSKKSIGEITIKELTDEADVHRGTFYHHYADAMDLKVQTEREIAEQLTEILSMCRKADWSRDLTRCWCGCWNIWRTTARLPRCWQASTAHRG